MNLLRVAQEARDILFFHSSRQLTERKTNSFDRAESNSTRHAIFFPGASRGREHEGQKF
jgi:hypothetical protein